jgi:hypothetical protein
MLERWDKNMEGDFSDDPGADLMFADQIIGKLRAGLLALQRSALRPATKYLTSTIDEQMDHIFSEVAEVENALEYENYQRVSEELVDLQMSCETLLTILGLDEQQRNEVRRKVIEKNAARGYYNGAV